MTSLLILHEKHGDRYFKFETIEELHKIALHVLKKRAEEDDWGNLCVVEVQRNNENQEKYAALKEYIKHVTHPQAVSLLNKEVDDLSKEIKNSTNLIDVYRRALSSLKESDGKKALEALNSRQSWEYENFDLDEAETVEDL